MQQTSQILLKTFSILNAAKVKCLLIGGQACVIYGAKTSTVDLDITILTLGENLRKLAVALKALDATPSPISVPLNSNLLSKGHSLHYYCNKNGLEGIRLDILGRLPRLDPFPVLWKRRFNFVASPEITIPILSIRDLIISKKTGRIKDVADITALVNSHYTMNNLAPKKSAIKLWLMEAREIDTLMMFVQKFSSEAKQLIKVRPLLKHAHTNDISKLKAALIEEATNEISLHEAFRNLHQSRS